MSATAKQQIAELNALLTTSAFRDCSLVQRFLYAFTIEGDARSALRGIVDDAADQVLALSDACRTNSGLNEEALASSLGLVHRRLLAASALAEALYQSEVDK